MEEEPNFPPYDDLPPGDTRYRGKCACGEALPWRVSRDLAWGELAGHLTQAIAALIQRGFEERRQEEENGA
jgi:hypothetical protein